MKKHLLLLFLPFLFVDFTNTIQKPRAKPKGNYALLFACEVYNDSKLERLTRPIADAKAIQTLLETTYNFKCELVPNPTTKEIINKIKEYDKKFENGTFDKEGQLFLFFSGHGQRDKRAKNGYFLTKDSESGALETAYAYATGRNAIGNLPCKHILVAIDACKSGSFDPETEKDSKEDLLREDMTEANKSYVEVAKHATRLFFASGSEQANTPDDSKFSKKLLEALASKGNGKTNSNDNILTYGEIHAYLSEIASPKPTWGKFPCNSSESDFLFVAREAESTLPDVSDIVAKCTGVELVDNFSTINVPGGTFSMGNDVGYQKPKHQVSISNFYISPNEVTFDEYDKYCEAEGKHDVQKPSDSGFGRGIHPVINVSWLDAVKYCNWLSEKEHYTPVYQINATQKTAIRLPNTNGYRLPTEAEWEYAAGFNPNRKDVFEFSGSADFRNVAVTRDKFSQTQEVHSKNKNGIGAYDMSGNVWEWVEDCWVGDYYNHSDKGAARLSGNCNERVLRGGSWMYMSKFSSIYSRYKKGINERSNDVGFRIVRSK